MRSGDCQVGPLDIDHLNILNATKMAMRMALLTLETVDMALFDAIRLDDIDCAQESMIKGDLNVNAIAAASIVAKVTRDRLMALYDREYPEYGFAQHKGYGTQAHMDVLRRLGSDTDSPTLLFALVVTGRKAAVCLL